MSKSIIESTRAVINELRLPGPIKPGLRKRLNELRVELLAWLAHEEQREPACIRQVDGPVVRKRVPKDGGGYTYVMLPTLADADPASHDHPILPGTLVRSSQYEAIETLVQLVGGCSSITPPRELTKGCGVAWSKQGVADAITDTIAAMEPSEATEPPAAVHPYKSFYKQFVSDNPKIRNPEAAAALEYWNCKLDKREKGERIAATSIAEAIVSFRRHFKYELKKT